MERESYPHDERRGYDGDSDSNELIYDATMQDFMRPGSDTEACECNIKDADGKESTVKHVIKDPYYMNCFLPGEIVQVKFDPQTGSMIPNGSSGLIRKCIPGADISVKEMGSAQIITEDENNEQTNVAEIDVYCDEFAVKKDVPIFVQYRRDLGKTAGDTDGITPYSPGRWTPIKGTAGELNIVRGYTLSPVSTSDAEFEIEATESHPGEVTGQQTVVNPEDARNSGTYGYSLKQGDYVTCTSWIEGKLLCIDGPCNSDRNQADNPPTDILLSNNDVDEDSPGAIVGTLSAVDADLPDDTHTYSIIGTDNGLEISGTTLKVQDDTELDSANSPIVVSIMVVDGGGHRFEKDFSITINSITAAGRFALDNVDPDFGMDPSAPTKDHADYGGDSIPNNLTWELPNYQIAPDDTIDFVVRNVGSASLAVSNISVLYDGNLITNVSKTTMSIGAASTDTVTLTLFSGFTPTVGDTYSGTITFLHNGDSYGESTPFNFTFKVTVGSSTPVTPPP